MAAFSPFLAVFQFIFFLTSPLTSYGDQIVSMHRRKSSAGFSIDVCGIMLHARYRQELVHRQVVDRRNVIRECKRLFGGW